jgi:hypothetical protein
MSWAGKVRRDADELRERLRIELGRDPTQEEYEEARLIEQGYKHPN